ncbi:hypothetical protein EDB83DRAFT_2516073 [Lactarius deliciosus]|nr:hypothetical protein EDB83DRAFT_2516073 [Lactarius deliciosus]
MHSEQNSCGQGERVVVASNLDNAAPYFLVLVKSPAGSSESHLGVISDLRLLSAFARSSGAAVPPLPEIHPAPTFLHYVSNPLGTLPLPSLNLHFEVVAVHSRKGVLDAMQIMSDLGVSSVAVLEKSGNLSSAISVTDIGQTWPQDGRAVTEQSYFDDARSSALFTDQAAIKMPQGWTDGADRYPDPPPSLSGFTKRSYAAAQYTACSHHLH